MKKQKLLFWLMLLVNILFSSERLQPSLKESLIKKSIKEVLGQDAPVHWEKVAISDMKKQDYKKLKIYRYGIPDTLLIGIISLNEKIIAIIPAQSKGKTLYFSFLLYIDLTNDEILDVDIVEYRESHGQEIDLKVFRKQFRGKKRPDDVRFRRTIKSITGATISARSVTLAVHDLMIIYKYIKKRNIINVAK